MKYESTILKRLIDTYGVVGNPRYISEIIKEFIVRGKERFPELFTYQADWLAHIDEFGLNPSYTVSYTGQSIYAPNTLERPVKSAILKGSTKYRDIETGEILEVFEDGRNLELVSVKMPVLTTTGRNLVNLDKSNPDGLGSNSGNGTSAIVYDNDKQGFYTKTNRGMCANLTVKPNTYYTISADFLLRCNNGYSFLWNNPTQSAGDTYNSSDFSPTEWRRKSVTRLSNKDGKINWVVYGAVYFKNLQIEEGSTATPYEPYKSNILSVNEPIELRGIGEGSNRVEDELNCLTGEVTERVGEIVLDGSEDWKLANPVSNNNNNLRLYCTIETAKSGLFTKGVISNRFATVDTVNYEGIAFTSSNKNLHISINKTKLDEISVNGFKQWLSQNPVTVQYHLETVSIKTVDLTIHDKDQQKVERLTTFEGGTHFTTSSQDGSLLPTLTVDVVTDLEETLAVCSLEGNTM